MADGSTIRFSWFSVCPQTYYYFLPFFLGSIHVAFIANATLCGPTHIRSWVSLGSGQTHSMSPTSPKTFPHMLYKIITSVESTLVTYWHVIKIYHIRCTHPVRQTNVNHVFGTDYFITGALTSTLNISEEIFERRCGGCLLLSVSLYIWLPTAEKQVL